MKELFDEIPYLESGRLVLKRMEDGDAAALYELRRSREVYRYLPTFLFEQKYEDIHFVITQMYDSCIKTKESLHLGIFLKDGMRFCGIGEFYGFRPEIHKVSLGYRLLERCWGQGIATEAVRLMVAYLYGETTIEIITASTMADNHASAAVLRKNDFIMNLAAAKEDWGYEEPTIADKWIR